MDKNKTPQNSYFKISQRLYTAEVIVYIVFALFAITQIYLESKLLIILNSISLILLFFIGKVRECYFDKAHDARRIFLFDDTFNESVNPHPNNQYYDNDDISPGLIRLLANTHVSSIFTYYITKNMLTRYLSPFILIAFIILVSFFISGINSLNSVILAIVLSGGLLNRVMAIWALNKRTKSIYNQFNNVCNDLNSNPNTKINKRKILDIIIQYESILLDTKIELSENIYNKNKACLTSKWAKLKLEYSIYN